MYSLFSFVFVVSSFEFHQKHFVLSESNVLARISVTYQDRDGSVK